MLLGTITGNRQVNGSFDHALARLKAEESAK
jgi:hypothetical protein